MRVTVSFEPPFSGWANQKTHEIEMAPGSTAGCLEEVIYALEPVLRSALENIRFSGEKFCFVYAIKGHRIDEGYVLKEADVVQVFSPLFGG